MMSLMLNHTPISAQVSRHPGDLDTDIGLFKGLDCLTEITAADAASGIQFRDCQIDYTSCPEERCIKKLL